MQKMQRKRNFPANNRDRIWATIRWVNKSKRFSALVPWLICFTNGSAKSPPISKLLFTCDQKSIFLGDMPLKMKASRNYENTIYARTVFVRPTFLFVLILTKGYTKLRFWCNFSWNLAIEINHFQRETYRLFGYRLTGTSSMLLDNRVWEIV